MKNIDKIVNDMTLVDMYETLIGQYDKLTMAYLVEKINEMSFEQYFNFHQLLEQGNFNDSAKMIGIPENGDNPYSQTKPGSMASNSTTMSYNAKLKKDDNAGELDSQDVKPGDEVVAKTADGEYADAKVVSQSLGNTVLDIGGDEIDVKDEDDTKLLDPDKIGNKVKNMTQKILDPNESIDDLERIKYLAGVEENSSGGATGAGCVASAPAPMPKMIRRKKKK